MSACVKCNGTGRYQVGNGVYALCSACYAIGNNPAILMPKAIMCPCHDNAGYPPFPVECSVCHGRKRVPIPLTEFYDVKDVNNMYGWVWR